MRSQHNFVLVVSSLLLSCLVSWSLGAAVVGEKREMPTPQYGGGGYSGGGGGYDAYAQQQAPAYNAPMPPQYGPTPYTNPGFSVQTVFEGFLVSYHCIF